MPRQIGRGAAIGQRPANALRRHFTTDALLSTFGKRKQKARERYVRFVAEGLGQEGPWRHLQQQIYLGDEAFVRRMQAEAGNTDDEFSVPKLQRRAPAASLAAIEASHADRNEAMIAAHASGAYSYREIAAHFGMHPASVGRIVRRGMVMIGAAGTAIRGARGSRGRRAIGSVCESAGPR